MMPVHRCPGFTVSQRSIVKNWLSLIMRESRNGVAGGKASRNWVRSHGADGIAIIERNDMTETDPRDLLKNSTRLADKEQVEAAIGRMADAVNAHYGDGEIILLIVMTGAVMPAAWLASRLKMPVQMD